MICQLAYSSHAGRCADAKVIIRFMNEIDKSDTQSHVKVTKLFVDYILTFNDNNSEANYFLQEMIDYGLIK